MEGGFYSEIKLFDQITPRTCLQGKGQDPGTSLAYLHHIHLRSTNIEHCDIEELEGEKYSFDRSIQVVQNARHALRHTGQLFQEIELDRRVVVEILRQA